jgi:hypothetical protein
MFLTRKTAIIRKNYQYKWNIFASFRSSVAFSFTKRRTAQNAVHNIKGDRLNSLETLPIADDCHLQAAVMHKRMLHYIKQHYLMHNIFLSIFIRFAIPSSQKVLQIPGMLPTR